MRETRLARRLLAAWLGATLALTLAPYLPVRDPRPWTTLSRLGTFDVLANVALYVPAGVLLVRLGARRALAVALLALLSVGTESAQMFLPFRHPSQLDVLANACGAFLGALLADPLWRLGRGILRRRASA